MREGTFLHLRRSMKPLTPVKSLEYYDFQRPSLLTLKARLACLDYLMNLPVSMSILTTKSIWEFNCMNYSNAYNYLTLDNGALVTEVTSSLTDKNDVNFILTAIRKQLWISAGPPPQKILISLKDLRERPLEFRCFGFDCWHDYQTNPAKIQIRWSTDGKKYSSFQNLQCQHRAGLQLFEIGPLKGQVQWLQLNIMQNFGEQRVYLNQVFLLQDFPQMDKLEPKNRSAELWRKPKESKQNMRRSQLFSQQIDNKLEDFFSQAINKSKRQKSQDLQANFQRYEKNKPSEFESNSFLKLTSTEKQVKKLNERVDHLERTNKELLRKNQSLQERLDEFRYLVQKMKKTVQTIIDNEGKISVQLQTFGKSLGKCTQDIALFTEREDSKKDLSVRRARDEQSISGRKSERGQQRKMIKLISRLQSKLAERAQKVRQLQEQQSLGSSSEDQSDNQ